jgi:hypothetical protein
MIGKKGTHCFNLNAFKRCNKQEHEPKWRNGPFKRGDGAISRSLTGLAGLPVDKAVHIVIDRKAWH